MAKRLTSKTVALPAGEKGDSGDLRSYAIALPLRGRVGAKLWGGVIRGDLSSSEYRPHPPLAAASPSRGGATSLKGR